MQITILQSRFRVNKKRVIGERRKKLKIGNKIFKKLLLLAVMISCMFSSVNAAYAADTEKIQMQDYDISQGEIKIYVHNVTREISKDNLMVKMNNQQLKIKDIQPVDLEVIPTTYYCLVDISGSLDKNRMAEIRNILDALVGQMKDVDNMCVTKFADNYETTGFINDKAALTDFISKIEVTKEDTNLYVHVKNSLELLMNDQAVNTNKCLIILSDGADEQETGITMDEALNMVKSSDIPVYTVAMLKEKSTEKQLESAKILGSFARNSAGGVHYAPMIEGIPYENICGLIKENMGSTFITTCVLKDVELTGNNAEVQVSYKDSTGQQYFNDKSIPTEKLKEFVEYTPVVEEKVVEEPVVEVVTEVHEEIIELEDDSNLILGMKPWLFYTILGVLVLIIIVSFVLILVNNKKSKAAVKEEPIAAEVNVPPVNNFQNENMFSTPNFVPDVPKKETKQGLKVSLVAMKGSEHDLTVYVNDSCKIGRDKTKCDFAVESDKSLSSVHCTLSYKGKSLYVRDEKSTNGSFVNGVPIDGEYKLEKDDILYIGSYEYRVNW